MSKKTRAVAAALGAVAFSLLYVSAAFAVAPTYGVTVDKTASPTTLPAGGGQVTYTYVVTNTSSSNHFVAVSITDNKCSTITFKESSDGTMPGGNGSNGFLNAGATWTYTCKTTLTATTTNTVTVNACHDGSVASCNNSSHDAQATDSATVTVATTTATVDLSGTSAALLALILLAIGGFGFFASTKRLPKLR